VDRGRGGGTLLDGRTGIAAARLQLPVNVELHERATVRRVATDSMGAEQRVDRIAVANAG